MWWRSGDDELYGHDGSAGRKKNGLEDGDPSSPLETRNHHKSRIHTTTITIGCQRKEQGFEN